MSKDGDMRCAALSNKREETAHMRRSPPAFSCLMGLDLQRKRPLADLTPEDEDGYYFAGIVRSKFVSPIDDGQGPRMDVLGSGLGLEICRNPSPGHG